MDLFWALLYISYASLPFLLPGAEVCGHPVASSDPPQIYISADSGPRTLCGETTRAQGGQAKGFITQNDLGY